MNKIDGRIIKTGLKRVAVAIGTTALFALSVYAFIATATASGYWAVVLFFAACVMMFWALILLYAQGLGPKPNVESKGDKHEWNISL